MELPTVVTPQPVLADNIAATPTPVADPTAPSIASKPEKPKVESRYKSYFTKEKYEQDAAYKPKAPTLLTNDEIRDLNEHELRDHLHTYRNMVQHAIKRGGDAVDALQIMQRQVALHKEIADSYKDQSEQLRADLQAVVFESLGSSKRQIEGAFEMFGVGMKSMSFSMTQYMSDNDATTLVIALARRFPLAELSTGKSRAYVSLTRPEVPDDQKAALDPDTRLLVEYEYGIDVHVVDKTRAARKSVVKKRGASQNYDSDDADDIEPLTGDASINVTPNVTHNDNNAPNNVTPSRFRYMIRPSFQKAFNATSKMKFDCDTLEQLYEKLEYVMKNLESEIVTFLRAQGVGTTDEKK